MGVMEPGRGKLTAAWYGRVLKQVEIHTLMDIFVGLAFIPHKWALGSNSGTLAKAQKVSSNWEVKRWGSDQRTAQVFISSEIQMCCCCCSCSDQCLGMQTLPSPSLLCCRTPVATARSLCPPDPLGLAWQGPADCRQTLCRSPFPPLLQAGSSSSHQKCSLTWAGS